MSADVGFEEWLSAKLQNLGTDQEVFGNYIIGILTSEETESEKRDALEDVLSSVTANETSELCNDIMKKWSKANSAANSLMEKIIVDGKNDVSAKIATIMEKQVQSIAKESTLSSEERVIREAILAQYSHVSDDEDYPSENTDERSVVSNPLPSVSSLARNTNSEAVAQAEKEKREKAKADSEKKKAQDKINREKQKQQQQERREKEKKRTQKGERKR